MDFVLASNNKGKVKEIKKIFGQLGDINVFSLNDLGIDVDVVEDVYTFKGNAMKKAKEIYEIVKKPVIADDSGLCVDALNGAPGVFSHRYAGEDDHLGNLKLLKDLEGVPFKQRTAQYVCVICYYDGKNLLFSEGICKGYIDTEEKGTNGFAFDPVFYLPEYKKTVAEVSDEIKNSISHRSKALNNMLKEIQRQNLMHIENNGQQTFIPFKEAIKLYQKGNTIYSYYSDGTCYNRYDPKYNDYGDLILYEIEAWEILEGKWSL